MAAKLVCRICISEVQPKHCTALFTEAGLQQDWLSYLHEMLLVLVESCDGLPVHAYLPTFLHVRKSDSMQKLSQEHQW